MKDGDGRSGRQRGGTSAIDRLRLVIDEQPCASARSAATADLNCAADRGTRHLAIRRCSTVLGPVGGGMRGRGGSPGPGSSGDIAVTPVGEPVPAREVA